MMESTDSPDKQIVRANGIPRGCMSFTQGPPLHLLRQAWNQLYCSWASLSHTSLGSLDGFLSNVVMLTLKSRQKEFDIMCTQLNTWKHLCLTMATKAQSKRCRQYLQRNRPKGVIARHFLTWHKNNVTAGQDGMIARHSYLNEEMWSDQSYKMKGTKEVP
jgi:hypothetical protein